MGVGPPEGPSYHGHSPYPMIFSPCCPLNDRRRAVLALQNRSHARILILLIGGNVHSNPGTGLSLLGVRWKCNLEGRSVQ